MDIHWANKKNEQNMHKASFTYGFLNLFAGNKQWQQCFMTPVTWFCSCCMVSARPSTQCWCRTLSQSPVKVICDRICPKSTYTIIEITSSLIIRITLLNLKTQKWQNMKIKLLSMQWIEIFYCMLIIQSLNILQIIFNLT